MWHPSPITGGLDDFDVCTEQDYMHTDPALPPVLAMMTRGMLWAAS
ncbi:MAG: hypothetical protein ACK4WM_01795 [Thermoflexales bacterium]